ncbi:enoyl-CoA hydratase/isomerase family protein [Altererythrobacter sp. MF3-039]|uniref:enoyl-CoA hydratase/isomerase family protein n=1 Tax=Altererythrobacter sp. MF3-039 TaxID=3252901 RepID=UPI00390CB518
MAQVTASDDGGVRLLTIANPPLGYMNAETATELLDHLREAQTDDAVRVIVFTGGVPGVFIRHYDVGEIVAVGEIAASGAGGEAGERADSPVYAMFDLLLDYPKPTIAAINGMCMGGGFEFALGCDIRIAQHGDYTIGLPETRLGIIPGLGGLQLLSHVVGLARAKEMVLRGRVVDPHEALRLGMVHELASDALAQAMDVARDLALLPQGGLAAVKRMAALVSAGEALDQGINTAATEFMGTLLANDEAMSRMREFLAGGEDIVAR